MFTFFPLLLLCKPLRMKYGSDPTFIFVVPFLIVQFVSFLNFEFTFGKTEWITGENTKCRTCLCGPVKNCDHLLNKIKGQKRYFYFYVYGWPCLQFSPVRCRTTIGIRDRFLFAECVGSSYILQYYLNMSVRQLIASKLFN